MGYRVNNYMSNICPGYNRWIDVGSALGGGDGLDNEVAPVNAVI